jgi:hexulose-6-phosphate isomerase
MTTPLDRRLFLQSTAVIGAATALSTADQAVAGSLTGKIKKAVKYHMITEPLSVMDKLKMVKDAGFDGVEPRTADAIKHRDALLKASQATGVKVHGIVNSSNPDIKDGSRRGQTVGSDVCVAGCPDECQGFLFEELRRAARDHSSRNSARGETGH